MVVIWENLELYAFLLARIASFIMVLPILGNKSVPPQAKIGLAALLAVFMFPLVQSQPITVPLSLVGFIVLIIKEALIGLVMGFITIFIFSAVRMAGEIVSRQMGFLMAKVFDPGFKNQVSIISEFYLIVMLVIYLLIDGHHFLLSGLVHSYKVIPVTAAIKGTGLETEVVEMAAMMFTVSIKVAAPVLVSLLLTNVALGIIARTVPQMNIFIVGMPLRIMIGFLGLGITLQLFIHIFTKEWARFQESFAAFIKLF